MKGPTWAGRVEDPASANSQAELVLIHFFPRESLILEGIKLVFNRETENTALPTSYRAFLLQVTRYASSPV